MTEFERLTQKLRTVLDEALASEPVSDVLNEIRDAGYVLGKATLTLVIDNRPMPIEVPNPTVDWLDRLHRLEDTRER